MKGEDDQVFKWLSSNVCSAEVAYCKCWSLLLHRCPRTSTVASTTFQGETPVTVNFGLWHSLCTQYLYLKWDLPISVLCSRLLRLRMMTVTMNWRGMQRPVCLWCLRDSFTQSRSPWYSLLCRRWVIRQLWLFFHLHHTWLGFLQTPPPLFLSYLLLISKKMKGSKGIDEIFDSVLLYFHS